MCCRTCYEMDDADHVSMREPHIALDRAILEMWLFISFLHSSFHRYIYYIYIHIYIYVYI